MPDWDVSKVTDMKRLFDGYSNFNANITAWDVSSVTDMSYMFQSANAFTQDLNGWDTSRVQNMEGMFQNVRMPSTAPLTTGMSHL